MRDSVAAARALAGEAHAGQTRPNSARSPFTEHYEEVAALVAADGGTPEEVAAALLHDAVEDTDVTLGRIAREVGPRVAEIVDGLTDPGHFAGMPLAERKALQAERVCGKDAAVRRVKIADQTSNVRSVAVDPPERWDAAKCMAYADGARLIVDACRDASPALAALFDDAYEACRSAHAPSAPRP